MAKSDIAVLMYTKQNFNDSKPKGRIYTTEFTVNILSKDPFKR